MCQRQTFDPTRANLNWRSAFRGYAGITACLEVEHREANVDIAAWLASLGLERYNQVFHENEIDVGVLPRLTADDLKDIGVVIVGHRRKLLEAIADLQTPQGMPRCRMLLRLLVPRAGLMPSVGTLL